MQQPVLLSYFVYTPQTPLMRSRSSWRYATRRDHIPLNNHNSQDSVRLHHRDCACAAHSRCFPALQPVFDLLLWSIEQVQEYQAPTYELAVSVLQSVSQVGESNGQ